MDAATEKKEVVLVTDDVLTIKDKFQEERELIGNRGVGGNHCRDFTSTETKGGTKTTHSRGSRRRFPM